MAGNLMKTDEELKQKEEEKRKKINLLKQRAQKDVKEDLPVRLSNFLSQTLTVDEKKEEKDLRKRLTDLRNNFLEEEVKIYKSICGDSFSEKEDPYKKFQNHISIIFGKNEELFNDIQKIAVRKSNASTAIRTLRDWAAELYNKESGLSKVILTPDEIKDIVKEIMPNEPSDIYLNDDEFKRFISENEAWTKKFESSAKIQKTKGQGAHLVNGVLEAVQESFSKVNLEITEENIRQELLPFYRNFFLNEFSVNLKNNVNKLIEDGAAIRAEKGSNGKTVLKGGLLNAIISARQKAIDATNDFFYEGKGEEGVEFSMEIDGKRIRIKPNHMFTVLKDNFANTLTDRIRDALGEKILEKQQQRSKASKVKLPDFSDVESIKDWLQELFHFSESTMNDIIGPALQVPKDKRREYFLSASPSQVIGDLSEILYGAFLNKLNPSVVHAKMLGGEKREYTDAQLKGITNPTTIRWKNKQQAATDLLLGSNVGIQVKNAFSEGALTTHSISFVSKKPVEDLFLQEFREITLKDQKEEELKQMTAEVILLKESEGSISQVWPLLVKIYTHYIDLILDLGFYDRDVFAGDKNLFYLYLSQYLIPASSIIDKALDSLSSGGTESIIKLQTDFKIGKKENLVSEAKMGIDFTFYNSFISNFDILFKTIQQEQN